MDFEVEVPFGTVAQQAKSELKSSDGWQQYAAVPASNPGKRSYSAQEMDALFLNEKQAFSIFREGTTGSTNVRVWTRNPTFALWGVSTITRPAQKQGLPKTSRTCRIEKTF